MDSTCLSNLRQSVYYPSMQLRGRAHRGHQLIRAAHARHLILVDELLHCALHRLIPPHEQHVSPIQREQHQRFLPVNQTVPETIYQHQQTDRVETTVTEQRPPSQSQRGAGEERASTDHEQDVEHGGAHDRADADVVERHEHADDGREELRGRAAGRHERGTGHVVADREPLDDHIQRRHEELVADDRERNEHVAHADHVENDGSGTALFFCEEVVREEGCFDLGLGVRRGFQVEQVGGVGLAGPRRREQREQQRGSHAERPGATAGPRGARSPLDSTALRRSTARPPADQTALFRNEILLIIKTSNPPWRRAVMLMGFGLKVQR